MLINKQKSNLIILLIALLGAYTSLRANSLSIHIPTVTTATMHQQQTLALVSLDSLGEPIDKIIASVNDQPILASDLEAEYQIYRAQKKITSIPNKCDLLNNMIAIKLLLEAAERKQIIVKKEEVDRYVEYKLTMLVDEVGSKEKLERLLGKPLSAFKTQLRKTIKEQMLTERVKRSIVDDISISPIEVKTFFNELETSQIPFFSARVEAYQLVLYPIIEQTERQNIFNQLEILKKRIRDGEDFATLARQYSNDSTTAANGGDRGFWKIGELEPAYEKAALNLLPGEVSDPVETPIGFHLIQLIERRRGQYNSRHIVLKSTSLEPSLQALVSRLDVIRREVLDKKISFEEAVKRYSQAHTMLPQYGLAPGGAGGLCVSVDQLPPDLFFVLDKLKTGEISAPTIFTDDSGKRDVRIIYLKRKVPSHQASLEIDYEQIYQMALDRKRSKIFEDWLTRMRQKALIEVDKAYRECK